MGQKFAKRDVEKGIKLFDDQRFHYAIEVWKSVLPKLDKLSDKFDVYGYLCMANLETGRYREVLEYAEQQLTISSVPQFPKLKAEAYFNLGRSYERLSDFKRSCDFCEKCLTLESEIESLHGYASLSLASSCLGLGELQRSLKTYNRSLDEARFHQDQVLELHVYIGLGDLYTTLKDNETGLQYHIQASQIAREFESKDPASRYQRRAAVAMAINYWKLGRLSEALEMSEEAMKQALTYGERSVQARCLLNFAEIHRKRQDFQRAHPRYESAYSITMETGERKLQLEVLAGMAKCAEASKDLEQAADLNEKALALSQDIGAKLDSLNCRNRLLELYTNLDREDDVHLHGFYREQLLQDLDLYCGVCGETFGETPDKLRPLPCAHIVHDRCIVHLNRPTSSSSITHTSKRRPCPSCRRKSASNPTAPTNLD